MIWIIITLFLLLTFVSLILYFALKRINQYEDLLIQFQNIISISSEKLKVVDSQGHYEADDETGFFFEQIKELQEMLNDLFVNEENEVG
jgi:hypothetical protein|tara:strand:+ start:896 stop:1162 length:267 start_codon:yes stop_codon:yes gene_type:complete